MGDSGGRAYTLKVASSAFLHISGLFGSDVVENQCVIIITAHHRAIGNTGYSFTSQ